MYSIDDFYLTHEDQVRLAASQPDNKLLQHRGQPGQILLRGFLSQFTKGMI